jgi:hypothetical protein
MRPVALFDAPAALSRLRHIAKLRAEYERDTGRSAVSDLYLLENLEERDDLTVDARDAMLTAYHQDISPSVFGTDRDAEFTLNRFRDEVLDGLYVAGLTKED